MNVRPAAPADQPSWLEMRRQLWPGSSGVHERDIKRYFAGESREPLAVLLAENDAGCVLGFVELSIRAYAEGCLTDRVAFLEGWFVVPDCRRQGAGRALIAAAENWALSQGCSEFASNTELDSEVGAAVHRAVGFVDAGSVRCFRKELAPHLTRAARSAEPPQELRLYSEFASWWPLMSPPIEYVEEAAFYRSTLQDASRKPLRSLLELGSGGGHNASHMKPHYETVVLVDLSPGMIASSRAINPELEHHQGDMRTVRLGRQFDAVFIHDAICYMTTESDLRLAIETAFVHCKPGGVALFAPDHLRENFIPATEHGGEDAGARGMRWVAWMWDPDPDDCTYLVDYAYLMRESDGSVRVAHDRHEEGLFARNTWLRLFKERGFEPSALPFEHSDLELGKHEIFVCTRPYKIDD